MGPEPETDHRETADIMSAECRSALMRKVATKNTRPERTVQRTLECFGIPFECHPATVAGTPDVILPDRRGAIFVHGCFWHGCDRCDRGRRRPKTNAAFWETKITQNRDRDKRKVAELGEAGWTVVVIWECQTKEDQVLEQLLRHNLITDRDISKVNPQGRVH